MKKILKVLVAGAIAFAAIGMAFAADSPTRVELSFGLTKYGSNDGVWYDSASGAFSNKLNPASWQAALRVPGWKVAFDWLGNASNTAEWGAYERSDELANPSLSRTSVYGGQGWGRVYGLTIGKTFDATFHGLHVGIEGGPFLYHTEWHETVWALSDPSTVIMRDDTNHTNLTMYGGVSARYGIAFAEYRGYYKILDGLVGRHANQFLGGVSLPF